MAFVDVFVFDLFVGVGGLGGCLEDGASATLTRTQHPNQHPQKKPKHNTPPQKTKVIEAHYLYGVGYDDIDIVIHPQSIVHSMIETSDSSVLAQLGWPDMRLPIMYTMSWPERVATSEVTWPRLDFKKASSLTFMVRLGVLLLMMITLFLLLLFEAVLSAVFRASAACARLPPLPHTHHTHTNPPPPATPPPHLAINKNYQHHFRSPTTPSTRA